MSLRWWLLALGLPLLLHAQDVVLVSVNPANAVESSIPSGGYNWGQVAAGDTVEVRFHARNLSAGPITITNITVSGPNAINFNEAIHTSSTPYVVPPGGGQDSVMAIFVDFSGTAISSYAATLSVTYTNAAAATATITTNLAATVVPAPVISIGPPCTGPDANRNIDFGRILQGSKATCSFTVQNPNTQGISVALTGTGFTSTFGGAATVGAGLSLTASLTFTAGSASPFTGTLVVGTRTYTLSGVGFSQPLPTPVWTFDNTTFLSGQQHTLAIGFASPSPTTASGTVTLTFTPSVSRVTDDVAVDFVASSQRVVSFTVAAGASALSLNGQPSIIFSTGTTAGTITFTMNAGVYGITGQANTTITVAAAPISIISSSATSRANDLDVVVTGFDNTYTAGPMSFTFFDRSGNQMGGVVTADFSSNFAAYFGGQTGGSAFLMRVSFPVTGDATLVGAVQATFNNLAGPARTGNLGFP